MNRPDHPIPASSTPRPPAQRPALPAAASRPGIAARWKARDRVSVAGN